jgi:hypothetical protein
LVDWAAHNRKKIALKEMTMHANGHITVWGTYLGVGRTRDVKGWYHELKAWWAAHKAARHEARLAALTACWDAKREASRLPHTDAASDMVSSTHEFSITTALCDLSV